MLARLPAMSNAADTPSPPTAARTPPAPIFHVVLHEPEIPNNTGNIGRTCMTTACALHLIKPFGFDTSAKALRRAGLDYWPRLAPAEHDSWDAYIAACFGQDAEPSREPAPPRVPKRWLFTTRASRPVWRADLRPGDHLVFGKETKGLPSDLLDAHAETVVTFPMVPHERSLNVATAVCAAIYEGLRQCADRNDIALHPDGTFTRRETLD
jgi:tRNA (cytidine/uridine-2'-O-)-methyltransferase